MQGIYNIKCLEGRVVTIQCDPANLKKELIKKELTIPQECLILYDEQIKAVVIISDLIFSTNTKNQQNYSAYDARKLFQVIDEYRKKNQNQEKNIEELASSKKGLEQQIVKLKEDIDKKSKEFENMQHQKGQETSKLVADYRSQLSQQQQESKKQIENLNQQMWQKETELTQQLEDLGLQKTKLIEQMDVQAKEIKQLKIKQTDLEKQIKQHLTTIDQKSQEIQNTQAQGTALLNQTIQQYTDYYNNLLNEQQQQMGALINQNTIEKDELLRKMKSENDQWSRKCNTFKTERDQLEDDKSKITRELSSAKLQLQTAQKKVESLTADKRNLEEEIENYLRKGTNESLVIQQKDKEIKKLKGDLAQLNTNLQNEQENYEVLKAQNQKLFNDTKQKLDEQEAEILRLNEEITNQATTIGTYKVKLDQSEKQCLSQAGQLKTIQEENRRLLTKITDLNIQISDFETKGGNKDNYVKELNQQIKQKNQEIEQLNQSLNEQSTKAQKYNLELQQALGQLKQNQIQLTHLQTTLDASKKSEKELVEGNKKMMDEFQKSTSEDSKRYQGEIELRDAIIKKFCQSQSQDKYYDKIIGPMEKLMNSEFKIDKAFEDPNSQRDISEYNIIEISLEAKKAQEYIQKQKWICLDECITYTQLGSIKTTRSIQPNADVTFVKGYIISIDQADQQPLQKKKLLRKEFKSQATPMFSKKEDAAKLSLNNLLCKVLLEKYNQITGQARVNGKQLLIQRQFILQVKGKEEYCYAEMIEEAPFDKINGGAFQLKNVEINQFLNAFSLFSYHFMKQQMIITNLQVVGNYLHDMIVSTKYQIFTSIDQGQNEIAQANAILQKAPQNALGRFWNESIENSAKQGWL